MDAINNPQNKMKVILVTGTNGKGSVVAYLSSILKEGGYKTGSFFSPHLVDYCERIRINGKKITKTCFAGYEKKMIALFEQGYDMTEFEALTAMAYWYFADNNIDFAVMEIGMGGRLDATNIADELLGIITNVELDHTGQLGRSIEEIAFEKAGILKKGTGIIGASGNALIRIKQESGLRGVPLKISGTDFFVEPVEINRKGVSFNYVGRAFIHGLSTSLLGRYQADNAALAVVAAEEIGIEEPAIRSGIKKATHSGRLELLSTNILVDCAHNPAGIGTLVSELSLFDYERLIVVFAANRTKDWKEMIRLLAMHADELIITKSDNKDAEEPEKIAEIAKTLLPVETEPNPRLALEKAKKKATKHDLVVVCGSMYMLGEILKTVKRIAEI